MSSQILKTHFNLAVNLCWGMQWLCMVFSVICFYCAWGSGEFIDWVVPSFMLIFSYHFHKLISLATQEVKRDYYIALHELNQIRKKKSKLHVLESRFFNRIVVPKLK